jgi:hypothetical protein
MESNTGIVLGIGAVAIAYLLSGNNSGEQPAQPDGGVQLSGYNDDGLGDIKGSSYGYAPAPQYAQPQQRGVTMPSGYPAERIRGASTEVLDYGNGVTWRVPFQVANSAFSSTDRRYGGASRGAMFFNVNGRWIFYKDLLNYWNPFRSLRTPS